MQTWLITGCSTGFGRELALAVLARGWHAAATARNPADIADIVAAHPERSLALKLESGSADRSPKRWSRPKRDLARSTYW
jgi:NAD(P)-dependent dehydrogenase (short-subunit alcohol dehydrogenase family)